MLELQRGQRAIRSALVGDAVQHDGFATALGDAVPVTSQNVSDELNSIFGFKGTVTVAGASNTAGRLITFAGASASTDVAPVETVFGACSTAPTPHVHEPRVGQGRGEVAGWLVNGRPRRSPSARSRMPATR